MPRERTLDERVRALERSVDAAAGTSGTTPEVGSDGAPHGQGATATTTGTPRSRTTDTPPSTAAGPTGSSTTTNTQDETGPVGGTAPADSSPTDDPGANGQQNGENDGENKAVNRTGSTDHEEPVINGSGSTERENPVRPRHGAVPHGDVESRLAAVEAELAELEAGLQAVRGYVGNIDHVNESVERRANAALAAVDRLESVTGPAPHIATCATAPEPSDGSDGDGTEAERERATPGAEPEVDQTGSDEQSTEAAGLLERLASLV